MEHYWAQCAGMVRLGVHAAFGHPNFRTNLHVPHSASLSGLHRRAKMSCIAASGKSGSCVDGGGQSPSHTGTCGWALAWSCASCLRGLYNIADGVERASKKAKAEKSGVQRRQRRERIGGKVTCARGVCRRGRD